MNSAAAVGQDNGRVSVQSGLDESEPIVPAPSAQLTEEEKGSIMASDRQVHWPIFSCIDIVHCLPLSFPHFYF